MSMWFGSLSRATAILGLPKSVYSGIRLSGECVRSVINVNGRQRDVEQYLSIQKRYLRGCGPRRQPPEDESDSSSSDDEKKRSRVAASDNERRSAGKSSRGFPSDNRFSVKEISSASKHNHHDRSENRFPDNEISATDESNRDERGANRFAVDPKLKTSRVRELLRNATTGSSNRLEDVATAGLPDIQLQEDENRRRQQSRHAFRPAIDPNQTSMLLFPGQGSQYVGMGKSLLRYPNVNRMFDTASRILGYDLKDVCMYGPKLDLDRTVYCQPAVVVTSLAAVEKLKDDSPHILDNCVAVAGFSVGEITALIFAGALSFEDGMKLVRIRAEAMQAASDENPGGMITVFYGADARIGFACSAAMEWCRKKGMLSPECVVANYLFPGCKVLAGDEEALKFIVMNAKDFGILRHKRLPVSGAFHTLLMSPAKEMLQAAMRELNVRAPTVAVHSNVDGKRYRNADHIRQQLPKQICKAVRWEQTMHVLYERPIGMNFPKTYECGPGKSLRTILKNVNQKAYDNCESVEM